MATNTTPLEYNECVTFADWLRIKKIPFTHVPNETFTRSWAQKAKNKRLGVARGVPDYMIVTPHCLVFVEMKRRKGSTTSKEQKEWMSMLNGCCNVRAKVCKGCDEAINFIETFL